MNSGDTVSTKGKLRVKSRAITLRKEYYISNALMGHTLKFTELPMYHLLIRFNMEK